jgi:hypothetical protein
MHKPWFGGYLELLEQRKQVEFQWLQYQSKINGDNWNNVRREISRHFRNKKRKYMKDKVDELATNSKNKNIRDLCKGINTFKRDSLPRSYFLKNENGDLLADSH